MGGRKKKHLLKPHTHSYHMLNTDGHTIHIFHILPLSPLDSSSLWFSSPLYLEATANTASILNITTICSENVYIVHRK